MFHLILIFLLVMLVSSLIIGLVRSSIIFTLLEKLSSGPTIKNGQGDVRKPRKPVSKSSHDYHRKTGLNIVPSANKITKKPWGW